MNLNSNGCILKIAVLVIRNLSPEYKKQARKKINQEKYFFTEVNKLSFLS